MSKLNLETNTKVAILGFGQEGQAIARYLSSKQIKPAIFEQKPIEEWDAKTQPLAQDCSLHTGKDYLDALKEYDVVFRSPGIKNEVFQKYLKPEAQVTSQTKLFFELCPSTIVGVTGTKGKGTTSLLIYELLKDRYKTYLTGNIGEDQPLDFVDELTPEDFVVYEMSSFQLQDLDKSPHLAVCLMVTEDHLDYHGNLNDYHAAKANITKFQTPQDFTIYNRDFPASVEIGEQGLGQKYQVSEKTEISKGVFIYDENLEFAGLGQDEEIDISQRKLLGRHNTQNIAAAALAAKLLGIDYKKIKDTVLAYKGLKFRLQLIAELEGVKYINDSISTNPDTALAAIKAFSDPVIAIVGGYDKQIKLDEFLDQLPKLEQLKAVVTIGQTGTKIKEVLSDKIKVYGNYQSMESAVTKAQQIAESGDVILLSPGFASFDMFKNAYDRGEQFNLTIKHNAS